MFSGSYDPSDVEFLVKVLDIPPTEVDEYERAIQRDGLHYSEMIPREFAPSAAYVAHFRDLVERNIDVLARDVRTLAHHIADRARRPIIVSLMRAGTPIGISLKRALDRLCPAPVPHYSVSIIRDRGLDVNAMRHIIEGESARAGRTRRDIARDVFFVDGWIGKGTIARELRRAVTEANPLLGVELSGALYVLSDVTGHADWCASRDDYLIPSSALNSTVSGLVSRSILNDSHIDVAAGDFHGCCYYAELAGDDLSRWYVDRVAAHVVAGHALAPGFGHDPVATARTAACLAALRVRYGVRDMNMLKPGIGETTRALLRRVPRLVAVTDREASDLRHIFQLAELRGATVVTDPDLGPYRCIAAIEEDIER